MLPLSYEPCSYSWWGPEGPVDCKVSRKEAFWGQDSGNSGPSRVIWKETQLAAANAARSLVNARPAGRPENGRACSA